MLERRLRLIRTLCYLQAYVEYQVIDAHAWHPFKLSSPAESVANRDVNSKVREKSSITNYLRDIRKLF